ncbi:hypothetical protein TNCV_3396991 [Trichonephila clavipes]|nr:hypothetical protein TNCV_3396991 [Trichonephila clavipes]
MGASIAFKKYLGVLALSQSTPELSSISTDGMEPDFTIDKILKKLIFEESRLKRSTEDQHEAWTFETMGRNPKLSRKKSQPSPQKKKALEEQETM